MGTKRVISMSSASGGTNHYDEDDNFISCGTLGVLGGMTHHNVGTVVLGTIHRRVCRGLVSS